MSVRSELAKLKTLMPGPIQIGSSYVTYERRLSWVMRGMRGDPAVLNLLRLNPGVRSLAPDSRDRLIEVVRALWIDDPQPPPREGGDYPENQRGVTAAPTPDPEANPSRCSCTNVAANVATSGAAATRRALRPDERLV